MWKIWSKFGQNLWKLGKNKVVSLRYVLIVEDLLFLIYQAKDPAFDVDK
jgi:hypothetical protein